MLNIVTVAQQLGISIKKDHDGYRIMYCPKCDKAGRYVRSYEPFDTAYCFRCESLLKPKDYDKNMTTIKRNYEVSEYIKPHLQQWQIKRRWELYHSNKNNSKVIKYLQSRCIDPQYIDYGYKSYLRDNEYRRFVSIPVYSIGQREITNIVNRNIETISQTPKMLFENSGVGSLFDQYSNPMSYGKQKYRYQVIVEGAFDYLTCDYIFQRENVKCSAIGAISSTMIPKMVNYLDGKINILIPQLDRASCHGFEKLIYCQNTYVLNLQYLCNMLSIKQSVKDINDILKLTDYNAFKEAFLILLKKTLT